MTIDLYRRSAVFFLALASLLSWTARAQNNLDQIGATLLRETTTNLNGSGIRVAQPEANVDSNTNNPLAFEVNPANVGDSGGLFTYITTNGSSDTYPNSLGTSSWHAESVGNAFYGQSGVATNIPHVDNYYADAFVQVSQNFMGNFVVKLPSTNINDPVVNQSFVWPDASASEQQAIDSAYDNYAANFNTLFISGAGNGGAVDPPSTCYNGIGVAAYEGGSSVGPTIDNGRCKPDITAPGGATSFSTPYVSGAAALLIQAGFRGDGGSDTNAATNIRTVKALLLNGALKPVDWTNSAASPLDGRYGAGVLNVFNSYEQLAGGRHGFNDSTSVSSGSPHPPTGAAGSVAVLNGWDYSTNSSSVTSGTAKHYFFNATNTTAFYTLTATLVWNRQYGKTAINNLDLYLYDCANSNLVMCSTSKVDNVEQIFVPHLMPGRYDLQVLMNAGGVASGNNSEPYALAFAFTTTKLNIVAAGSSAALTWPAYPAGFKVVWATNLVSPVWSTNQWSAPAFTNGQNYLWLNPTNPAQFFRLHQTP